MRATVQLIVVLALATVMAFASFDRDSHSVSDTVRPLVTLLPLWAMGLIVARSILRRR